MFFGFLISFFACPVSHCRRRRRLGWRIRWGRGLRRRWRCRHDGQKFRWRETCPNIEVRTELAEEHKRKRAKQNKHRQQNHGADVRKRGYAAGSTNRKATDQPSCERKDDQKQAIE